jgi:hypothetical protein
MLTTYSRHSVFQNCIMLNGDVRYKATTSYLLFFNFRITNWCQARPCSEITTYKWNADVTDRICRRQRSNAWRQIEASHFQLIILLGTSPKEEVRNNKLNRKYNVFPIRPFVFLVSVYKVSWQSPREVTQRKSVKDWTGHLLPSLLGLLSKNRNVV